MVLGQALPSAAPATRERYATLLADPLRMLRQERQLCRSVFFQVTVFGGFSAAWTALALLITGPRYDMGTQTGGLVALIGGGSMFCAPAAGRWVDRLGADWVNLWCILAALAAAAELTSGVLGGTAGLVGPAAGLLLLDVAVRCGQVANQARIFALRPEARSRLNTGYMTCAFLGGSAGSWLGARAYATLGRGAVCALIALTALLPLAAYLVGPAGAASRVSSAPTATDATPCLTPAAPSSSTAAAGRARPAKKPKIT